MNHGLVDWQSKSISMLSEKCSRKWQFWILTVKVFPLENFAIYGISLHRALYSCNFEIIFKTGALDIIQKPAFTYSLIATIIIM